MANEWTKTAQDATRTQKVPTVTCTQITKI